MFHKLYDDFLLYSLDISSPFSLNPLGENRGAQLVVDKNIDNFCYLPGKTITPNVQNSSIQHKIVSLYLPGWNSPR